MLKKWLKKRLTGSRKKGQKAADVDEALSPSPTRTPPQKRRYSGVGKNIKSRSPGRSSKYTNIETEESRLSYTQPIARPIVDHEAHREIQRLPSKEEVSVSLSDVPLITRITPPSRTSKTRNSNPITAKSADSKKNHKETPPVRIRPIQGPPADRQLTPTRLGKSEFQEEEETSLPPSSNSFLHAFPKDDPLSRDWSALDNAAGPPSIDTALFVPQEDTEGGGDGESLEVGTAEEKAANSKTMHKKRSLDRDTPPNVIQAVLPTKHVMEDRESAADMGTLRPWRDDNFFTATKSQSGTGSKQLGLWMDEIHRSIKAQCERKRTPEKERQPAVDPAGVPPEAEEEGEEGEEEELEQAIKEIESTIEEQIEKQKSVSWDQASLEKSIDLTKAPRGILKSKTVDPDTIRPDCEVEVADLTETSESSAEERHSASEEHPVAGTEDHPIKVFSKSRRQILQRLDDDDETTSIATSLSSTGSSELAYETLRQIHSTLSQDASQKTTQSGVHLFYSKICEFGGLMDVCENQDVCLMDDVSIADDTLGSVRSDNSNDSYRAHGGWMCFDAL